MTCRLIVLNQHRGFVLLDIAKFIGWLDFIPVLAIDLYVTACYRIYLSQRSCHYPESCKRADDIGCFRTYRFDKPFFLRSPSLSILMETTRSKGCVGERKGKAEKEILGHGELL